MMATIAEKKNFSDRSDHKETTLQRSLESGFHIIAAIAELFSLSDRMVAIIWNFSLLRRRF